MRCWRHYRITLAIKSGRQRNFLFARGREFATLPACFLRGCSSIG